MTNKDKRWLASYVKILLTLKYPPTEISRLVVLNGFSKTIARIYIKAFYVNSK